MKKLEVLVKELQTKEGKKFNAYKVVTNEGKLMDLKFRKAVKTLPEKNCFINVKEENISIDRNRKYPVAWIHEVDSIEEKFNPEKQADNLPF